MVSKFAKNYYNSFHETWRIKNSLRSFAKFAITILSFLLIFMNMADDEIVLKYICELREILESTNGVLVKSRISPEDYFINLSYAAPDLRYEVGISKLVVTICELISTLLLEDTVSRVLVMIFEHYFLVSPILFRNQGPRFVNDTIFMKHFMKYVRSLSKTQVQKELDNIIASWPLESS